LRNINLKTSYDEGTQLRTGSKGTMHIRCFYMVIVVQLVRTSDCGSEGREFESHLSPKEKVVKAVVGK